MHLRVQLSCRVLTLTLWSKGRVLTSVTSRYQPSFEATIQLMNFVWFIVYFVVIHSLDYCKVTQDGQLLTSLRFIWKLTKLCRVGSRVAHCTPLEKCTHNLQQAWPLPSWTDHARLVVRVSARKNLIGCGAAGPQFKGEQASSSLVSWRFWFTSCQFVDTFMKFAPEKW